MAPLLETKLHVPKPRRGRVTRPRLIERLSMVGESALTLLSAPAGFGKTTLLADWLAAAPDDGLSVAWLSLDERDNDPTLFWTYVIAALRTAVPAVGAGALALLRTPQSSMDAVLATLLNELDAVPGDVVLVLDDYHLVEDRDVNDGVAFLLEHLPSQVHLLIATRADPAMPMARLRGRGELLEVRAAELRFTPDEAAAYLNDVMGLELGTSDVAALEGRTEGWIAALQLAALSLRGRDDAAGFIAGFAGDDRYVVDYLAEEVLQRQTEEVRTFLLRTSILGRLTGSLCDAVTGQDGGNAMLHALDRENLFLIPLDDGRHWYRYHHLFADVLRTHLRDEEPESLSDLHGRASDWYERNGQRSEAIDHALAAGDYERVADLAEPELPALARDRQEATLRRWMEALPVELFATRPVLSVGYAGALMSTGEVEGVDARLRDAERWLAPRTAASGEPVVVDGEGFRRLPAGIAMYRAGEALIEGDLAASMTHARRALDLADPDDHPGRGGPAALLGLAYWTSGDLEQAYRWYAAGMASLDKAGYRSDVIGGAVTLADIRIAQGRLREAMSLFQRGLLRAEQSDPALRGAADMHVGMAALFRERNDLDAARHHLRRSQELGEPAGLPKNPYRRRLGMAQLRQLDGDLDGALDLLDEAERFYNSDFSPDVQPVSAVRARMSIAHGKLRNALDWVRERGLSADDDLDYVREFEHVTLARVLLATHREEGGQAPLQEAARLLDRLRRAAEDGGRTGSLIEILVLQSLTALSLGHLPAALPPLRRALELAEPEGYVRTFVDEGAPLAAVLQAIAKEGTASRYVRRLLAAFEGAVVALPDHQPLIDPLSARELDVLRLLGGDLDGPAIARELFVSLNTVRTHTKNIYAKLGVTNRRAAVRTAQQLDLLARGPDHRPRLAVVPDR